MLCAAALLILGLNVPSPRPALPNDGVPASIMKRLTRGVNITRWFNYTGQDHNVDHFKSYMIPADFTEFKTLGLGCVRLCVGPQEIYRDGAYDPITLSYVDKGVQQLIGDGLMVIWDLHDNGSMKLSDDPSTRPKFTQFWKAIAEHYKGKYEGSLVFELKNEPMFPKNPGDWYQLQEDTVKAVRRADPQRTIMVTDTSWSSIDTLAGFKPLPQKNLIYTVHCYDPFFFTHQGASWVGAPPSDLKQVPFPSSPEAVSAIMSKNPDKEASTLKWYGEQKFNAAYLESRMKMAMDYARANHVPIFLGEFGSNPPVAPEESRSNWFKGMRAAFDKTGIPWCLWGYDDGMGLGRRVVNGQLVLDPNTLSSLFGIKGDGVKN